MNKKIKRIIATSLVVGAFSVLEPVKYINIMTETVYADDDIYLSGISVTDGDDIVLNSSKKTYKTNVPNSSEQVIIRVTTKSDTDKVKIDGNSSLEMQGNRKYKLTVNLDKGINTFDIVVQDEDGKKERDYTLKIDRGGKQSIDYDSVFLYNINLDYGDLNFLKTTTEYNVNVPDNVEELRVEAKPEDDNDTVRINGIKVDEDGKYRKTIKLTKGENEVVIDLEDDEDDSNTKTYTLNVYRGNDPSKQNAAENTNVEFDNYQDPIYLDDIVVNNGDLKYAPNFNKKISSYALDVSEDTENILVKAEAEEASNLVRINGVKLNDTNRKQINLVKGKNVIPIQVNTDCDEDEDSYEKRIYNLTVYRGASEGTSSTANKDIKNNNSTKQNTTDLKKANQWINVNGAWQYTDSSGNLLKNTWYSDKTYGKTYYFDSNGNMATGWLSYNGAWYYLDETGAKVTGWKQLGINWYYLDNDGKMKTGWFKDANGKWYYLYYSSGIMATGTAIDGYKLRADGAMIN